MRSIIEIEMFLYSHTIKELRPFNEPILSVKFSIKKVVVIQK